MGRLPSTAKGRMRTCVVCGFFYPERDPRITKQDDRWVCRNGCYDTLREKDRKH
jgi:hypothetical protein